MSDGRTNTRIATLMGMAAGFFLAVAIMASGVGRAQSTDKPTPSLSDARAAVKEAEETVRSAEEKLRKTRAVLARVDAAERRLSKDAADDVLDQTDQVEGIWRIVGIDGKGGREFRQPPYDEYKILSAGHYFWLSFDPATGKVIRSGGGVYSIKDGKYKAQIEYSNSPDLRAAVGKDYTGTFKLEDKLWFHFGKVPTGGTFDELWERVH